MAWDPCTSSGVPGVGATPHRPDTSLQATLKLLGVSSERGWLTVVVTTEHQLCALSPRGPHGSSRRRLITEEAAGVGQGGRPHPPISLGHPGFSTNTPILDTPSV